jgi:hypothetical protein
VRARVEHVFGHQQSAMGGKIVRTIGIARARFKIGMMNLGYNAHATHGLSLLRSRAKRHYRRAPEKRDERAASHGLPS